MDKRLEEIKRKMLTGRAISIDRETTRYLCDSLDYAISLIKEKDQALAEIESWTGYPETSRIASKALSGGEEK